MNSFELENCFPMEPIKGPPLPRFLNIYWPWYKPPEPPEVGTLSGKVTNIRTGLPIVDVLVKVNEHLTSTDSKGRYSLTGLEPADYLIEFSKAAYETVTADITIIVGPNLLDARLEPIPVPTITRMNLKSYGNHNERSYSDKLGSVPYDDRVKYIRPELVIDNPAHGAWGEFYGNWEGLLQPQMIAEYKVLGIKVIGYITGGYEGTGSTGGVPVGFVDYEFNRECIRKMFEIDGVDGIFIDECSSDPTRDSGHFIDDEPDPTRDTTENFRTQYLRGLVDLIHSYGGIAWINTGIMNFNEHWYLDICGCDYAQATEQWQGQSIAGTSMGRRGDRIGTTGYKGTYKITDAARLTLDAWDKGIAYCYINTIEYTDFAPWFEDYIDMLRVEM